MTQVTWRAFKKKSVLFLRDITSHLADEVHRICSSFKTPTYFSHDGVIRDRFQADAELVSVQGERNNSSGHVWRKKFLSSCHKPILKSHDFIDTYQEQQHL